MANANNKFAIVLRQEREKRNMTLEEMAQFLNTSKQVLSRYERGERNPKLVTAAIYAQKLGIPIETFSENIDAPMSEVHSSQLSESEQMLLNKVQKHADAIELLESLPEEKRQQAIEYLRFLSMQADNK